MFSFFMRWLEKRRALRRERLLPESKFVLEVTEVGIKCIRPNGDVEQVSFSDLVEVRIDTNDSGPWGADLWWVLLGSTPTSGCVYPGGATGEQVALDALQRLPGFDNEKVIQAMGSTDNASFKCWVATPNHRMHSDGAASGPAGDTGR
jgi:hypothetical protein